MAAKYIIVDVMGIPTPIIFPEHLDHATFISGFHEAKIKSAGFVSMGIQDVNPHAFGKSVTLSNMKSNPKEDNFWLEKLLKS